MYALAAVEYYVREVELVLAVQKFSGVYSTSIEMIYYTWIQPYMFYQPFGGLYNFNLLQLNKKFDCWTKQIFFFSKAVRVIRESVDC